MTRRVDRRQVLAWLLPALSLLVLLAARLLPDTAAVNVARGVHGLSVLAACAAMAASAVRGDARLRGPRLLFATALGASAAGFAIAGAYAAVLGYVPTPSLADLAALLWVPCAVIGLLLIPARQHREGGRWRAVCDAVIASSALSFASWLLVLKPIYELAEQTGLAKATMLAYPVVDIVVAVTALSVAAHARHDMRRLLHLTAAGLLLIAVSDSGSAVLTVTGATGLTWTHYVLQTGLLCLLSAALVPGDRAGDHAPRQIDALMDAALPYLPVVVAMVVGLFNVIRGNPIETPEAVIGAVMLTGLLARQGLYARHLSNVAYRLGVDASEDPLTGLANRRAFLTSLDVALRECSGGTVAVAVFDLDGFKEVNDRFGHAAGDAVLQEFAQRLATTVGESGLTARLGGDEFAAVFVGDQAADAAVAAARRITDVQRIGIGTGYIAVGATAGIATNRTTDTTSDTLKRADLALYEAKHTGMAQTRVFSEEMAARMERRHLVAQALAGAAERGEFQVVYQPLFRLDGGRIAGAEALLRWHDPVHGDIGPSEFITLAEQTGSIVEIGDWVLREALTEFAAWRRDGDLVSQLFINVSPLQLLASFADTVVRLTTELAVPAEMLTLEITETALPTLQGNAVLHRLRDFGVRIAMDDFGAGYSSLAQLAFQPVNVLKIDRDFIRGLHTDNGRRVIQAVITLANDLGLTTVAEGVEAEWEAEALREAGCVLAQGYHLAYPMPADDLRAHLSLGRRPELLTAQPAH